MLRDRTPAVKTKPWSKQVPRNRVIITLDYVLWCKTSSILCFNSCVQHINQFSFLTVLTGKKCRPFKVNATTTIGIRYECKWFKSRYYLPLEKGTTIHLNKRTLPSSKNALCQVWLKDGTMVFEIMIFIRRQCIFAISQLYPPGKGHRPYLKIVPSLIESWLSGFRSGEEF